MDPTLNNAQNITGDPIIPIATLNPELITARINDIENALQTNAPRLEELSNAMTSDQAHSFYEVSERYKSGELPDDEIAAELSRINPTWTNVDLDLIVKAQKVIAEYEALKQEASSYERGKLKLMSEQLNAQIDWEKILNYYENPDPHNTETHPALEELLWNYKQILSYMNPLDMEELGYDQCKYEQEKLQRHAENLRKFGFLLESEHAADNLPQEEYPTQEQLLKQAESITRTLTQENYLFGVFRSAAISFVSDKSLERFLDKVKFYIKGDEIPEIEYAGSLRNAFSKFISKKHQNRPYNTYLTKQKETINDLSIDEVINKIYIEGLAPLLGHELVVSETEILDTLRKIPPVFLDKVHIIYKSEASESKEVKTIRISNDGAKEETTTIWDTMGRFEPNVDKDNQLISSDIYVYSPCSTPPSKPPTFKQGVKDYFLHVVAHEVAHGIHYQLEVQDMENWLEITGDDFEITNYVARSRQDNWHIGVREDFCESCAIFITNPLRLQTENPIRFNYFLELFAKNLPESQREAYRKNATKEIDEAEFMRKERIRKLMEKAKQYGIQ